MKEIMKKEEYLKNILKKQEEERKKYEKVIREAQERERKIQEEQRKIVENAKKRNREIESLNCKISDNLSSTGIMVKFGVALSASSFLLGSFLFKLAGVSAFTSVGSVASSGIGITF